MLPVVQLYNPGASLGDLTALTVRVSALEAKDVKVTYFESIIAGTTGTLTIPVGATIVLDNWGAGVDALLSTMSGGRPTFESPVDAAGTVVTTTLDAAGNYTFSGTPSAYPVGIIYVLTINLVDYDNLTQANIIEETELEPWADEINIVDAGGYYIGSTVETALQEIGAGTTLDGRYVEIAGDTMTGDLAIQATGNDNSFLYINEYSSDHDRYGRLYFQKSHSNVAGVLTETEDGDYLGNIKYLGVNNASAFAGGAYMSVQQFGAAGAYVPTKLEWATYSAIGVNNDQFVMNPDGTINTSSGFTVGGGLTVTTNITIFEDSWIGIGSAIERIVFNGSVDTIGILGANLGIGTDDASVASLTIKNVAAFDYAIHMETDSSGRAWRIVTPDYTFGVDGSTVEFWMGAGSGDTYALIDAYTQGKNAFGNIILQRGSGGNVIIGNQTTPLGLLHVEGTGYFTSTVTAPNFVSTIAIGTAPFTVTSTTLVANLHVARAALSDLTTTNANLTGPITSIGNATSIAAQTGTGTTFAMQTSPTFVTQITTPSIISAAAMGITPAAGSNLNITISGAGLLAVNTDEFVVDPGVGVGIGTPIPDYSLQVKGVAPTGIAITDTTTPATMYMFVDNTVGYIGTATNHQVQFLINNVPKMTILTDGNVIIGATASTRILGIGGLVARNIGMERGTVANTAGFALTLNAGAATVASTDKAGGYIDIKGGLSTGNAETGVRLYGNTAGASGTADSAYYLMHHILGNKQAWYNTSPVVKQTGYAVPTDLASCIAALTAWRTAAINYGLMTTV